MLLPPVSAELQGHSSPLQLIDDHLVLDLLATVVHAVHDVIMDYTELLWTQSRRATRLWVPYDDAKGR